MPRKRTPTYIEDLEKIADEVSDWGKDYVEEIVNLLAPNGRPFGAEKLSPKAEAEKYLTLRGNPLAWRAWVEEKVAEITNFLAGSPERDIMAVRPYEIALRYAWAYSAEQEQALAKFFPELANPVLVAPEPVYDEEWA